MGGVRVRAAFMGLHKEALGLKVILFLTAVPLPAPNIPNQFTSTKYHRFIHKRKWTDNTNEVKRSAKELSTNQADKDLGFLERNGVCVLSLSNHRLNLESMIPNKNK